MTQPITIAWFADSPDPGPDCLCSICMRPILDIPVRMWDDDKPLMEARFHVDPCLEEFRASPHYASLMGLQTCRICGCTDEDGCPKGCYWVEDDLCSSCAANT